MCYLKERQNYYWCNNEVEVAKVLDYVGYLVEKLVRKSNRYDTGTLKEELKAEVIIKLINASSLKEYAFFDENIKKYARTVVKNEFKDLLKKNEVYRKRANGDPIQFSEHGEVLKTVQIYKDQYSTLDIKKDESGSNNTVLVNGHGFIGQEDSIYLTQLKEAIYEVLEDLLSKIDDSPKRCFLTYALLEDCLGMTQKDLAQHVGFDGNGSQEITRFRNKIKAMMEIKGFEIDF